jgi:hypothetical protein
VRGVAVSFGALLRGSVASAPMYFARHASRCSTLQETTNIPVDELKRHVLSLTTPKLRILNKSKKVCGEWRGPPMQRGIHA